MVDATQIHSSLLSISVGALLLPAAYHFALNNNKDETGPQQKLDILKMSHGVCVFATHANYLLIAPHLLGLHCASFW